MSTAVNRRQFLTAAASAAALTPFQIYSDDRQSEKPRKRDPIAQAAPYVRAREVWKADHLFDFLSNLPPSARLSMMQELELLPEDAGVDQLHSRSRDVREIQKQVLWISSNIFTYPFRDETELDYHQLVRWVAEDAGVDEKKCGRLSTFALEREIQLQIFAQMWDNLTVEQRAKLLEKIDPHGKIKDRVALTALGGAAALGVLSTSVAFTGFAFYTTMAVTISTVAGFFGVTLPFAAYTGASSLVAFLSGPVGWAVMGLVALGGVALAGRANVVKSTAFVCQIHSLKVAALIASGTAETAVFGQPAAKDGKDSTEAD